MGALNLDFTGRVAVITGAGSGLGRAYALELARRGAKIVVNDLGGSMDGSGDRSTGPADRVVDEIRESGGEAVPNYDNVVLPEGGENIVKTAVDAFGKVDILINNAGILRDKSFIKMEPENWDAVVSVHLKGAYCVTRPAFKVMKENKFGRIIMTTSAAGLYGNFGQTNYSSAKMGVVGLMNTLKLEGANYDIKVNTIAPIAATRLTAGLIAEEGMAEKMNPEFVTPMVICLCSEECPVTGNIYNAGFGIFNRAALFTGQAIRLGDVQNVPNAEEIMAEFERINSMEDAKSYPSLNELMADFLQAT